MGYHEAAYLDHLPKARQVRNIQDNYFLTFWPNSDCYFEMNNLNLINNNHTSMDRHRKFGRWLFSGSEYVNEQTFIFRIKPYDYSLVWQSWTAHKIWDKRMDVTENSNHLTINLEHGNPIHLHYLSINDALTQEVCLLKFPQFRLHMKTNIMWEFEPCDLDLVDRSQDSLEVSLNGTKTTVHQLQGEKVE